MNSPIWEKMYIKPGMKLRVIDPPEVVQNAMALETELDFLEAGIATNVLWFVASKEAFHQGIAATLAATVPGGRLWIGYPKQSAKLGVDIHRDSLNELAQAHHLRAIRQIAIDSTWSVLGFQYEKKVQLG